MPVSYLNDRWAREAQRPPERSPVSPRLTRNPIALTPAELAQLKKRGVIDPPSKALAATGKQSIVINGAAAQHAGIRRAFVEITPAMAAQWLALNNHGNRRLRPSTVAAYATDMRNGAWLLNHQGIAFDAQDTILDGQHRLAAIVESGISQVIIVSTGWPVQPEKASTRTMDTVDRGLSRSVADLLGLQHGISDARVVVMACNSIAALCLGSRKKAKKLSVDAALKIAGLFKEGVQETVGKRTNTVGLRNAAVLGAVALAWSVQPRGVAEFYESLKTGAGLDVNHPALSLRNYLLGQNAHARTALKENRLGLAHAVLTHVHASLNGLPLSKLTVRGEAVDYFMEAQRGRVAQVRAWLLPAAEQNK